MRSHYTRLLIASLLALTGAPSAHAATDVVPAVSLRQLSQSVESLVERVAPSVVEILVTGYGPVDNSGTSETGLVVGPQRSMGSGVIVDADGYIITNAHVVAGAKVVRVLLPGRPSPAPGAPRQTSMSSRRGTSVDARIVGVARELDLALLKIERTGLPPLPLGDYSGLRQGQLVLAFGSPEGLQNSVTMGVVSAVARQPDPDRPMIYVQTDAPINHGNSGGPLINVAGEIVGINTMILSDSGGSQGLGFAIPSSVVQVAYNQLRQYGHLHRGTIGLAVQAITPELAEGLNLDREDGVVVSDLRPDGPAEEAGLRVEDVITTIDGTPVMNVIDFALTLFTRSAGDQVVLTVVHDGRMTQVVVPVEERHDNVDVLTEAALEGSRIPRLGALGIDLDETVLSNLGDVRLPSGVLITAREEQEAASENSLVAGDIIHAVNGRMVTGVADLRSALDQLAPDGAVALQFERDGKLRFMAFR